MNGTRPWEEKLQQNLKHSVDADPQDKLNKFLSMLQSSDRLSNGIGMFSEVTYSDELGQEPVNLGANRSYQCLFFEITTLDGKKRYRSALTEDELLTKYRNIRCMRQIKQQEYSLLREHSVHVGEDDLE